MQQTPAELLQEQATRISERSIDPPNRGDSHLSQAIAFDLGGRTALVSMAQVSEVMEVPAATRVPGVRDWVLGVANVRGNIVPLIDLARFFELGQNTSTGRRAVIAIERPDTRLGLVVERVVGMRTIDLHSLSPAGQSDGFAGCTLGVAEIESQQLPVLDIDQMLGSPKFNDAIAN